MDLIKFLVEFIGTFIFLSVILITGQAIPIGVALAAMVYWGGSISGGAFNPAVSLALFMKKQLNGLQLCGYFVAQFIGAVCAFYFFRYNSNIAKLN
jgi:glycerol uptake facilitator-like aquaporin